MGLSLLGLACGLACSRRESPQAAFDHVYLTFLHGDLKQAEDEAESNCQRFQRSSSEWAWRFRTLEAEVLLWRGMYPQVLALLRSEPILPSDRKTIVRILALEGASYARLHQFSDAERQLSEAERLCSESADGECGIVTVAQGVLANQRALPGEAQAYFKQSLQFARGHGDPFLEATAVLDVGASFLHEEHFDEAMDWLEMAQTLSTALGAEILAQKSQGNLGWAYYNLGDSEKSLELSLEAEKRAIRAGDVIDQLSWLTNAGYVYQQMHDVSRAKQSYVKALQLAREINGREDIYNALRALALVSAQSGELQEARTYSDEAISIAQKDNNRLDELYPLLVKGLIAAQAHDASDAEHIFREVEQDPNGNAFLKWRAEHGLARLYEGQSRQDLADGEYRAALITFEAARSSLKRNDSKLPFSNNAASIYDDYIHFLVARGKTEEALRWADYSRARTLSEGLGLLSKAALNADHAGPPALNPREISHRANGMLLFYWLGKKQSYLWAVSPQQIRLFPLPSGAEIDSLVQRYRKSLTGPEDVLASSEGRALYRTLVSPAKALLPSNAKVFIIPDGSLNNLNFETLVVDEPKPHFWIEDADLMNASSLRVLAASLVREDAHEKKRQRKLLLIGDSVAPSTEYPELPRAGEQMASVARHFPAMQQQVFQRDQATPAAYLGSDPEKFSHIHFVAHGTASRLSPLDSAIVLSKGPVETDSFKLYARDIVQHPMHADLVTISACYGAGSRAYSGEGLVGLAWAFLRAGAHNVIASLWEVTDSSTEQLMNRFYDELDKGASPDAALRAAKLALLHGSAFHNPFYWAPFQLYTGS
ncbi:MAG: CHAT domain-containing protein [Candidatus Sulfotelmatobacter sp.]